MAQGWKLPWAGGCLCGRVRFVVASPPLLSMACHCRGCQRLTGSAYSLSLSIPVDGFYVTQGEPELGALHGPSRYLYCGWCKSWLFTEAAGLDWFVNIRATMLDDHAWFTPYIETYTDEGLPWAKTGAPHSFPGMPGPEVFQTLVQSYAQEAVRSD